MSAVFFASFFLLLCIIGFIAPFVLALCYIWVDLLKPQALGYDWIHNAPLSFVAAVLAVISYMISGPRPLSRITFLHILLVVWALWVTFTTLWAVLPDFAWAQWNTTIKTILFCALIPFMFRTRPQIDAFVLFLVLVPAVAILPAAAKTLITGGGYGSLPLLSTSVALGESSTLSMVAVMTIPLAMYAANNSCLIERARLYKFAGYAFVPICLIVSIGTQARTGLISMVVLSILSFVFSEKKFRYAVIVGGLIVAAIPLISSSWSDRMQTILDPHKNESRRVAWRFGLGRFQDVESHPFGGGFEVYRTNKLVITKNEPTGRAFHSIYFQVLGEHGYIGLVLYILLLISTLNTNFRLYRKAKEDKIEDAKAFSKAMILCTSVFMFGGAFIGIAYLPILYYLVAITISADSERHVFFPSTPIAAHF